MKELGKSLAANPASKGKNKNIRFILLLIISSTAKIYPKTCLTIFIGTRLNPWSESVSQVHLLESAVYHQSQGYAGRLDCLGEWSGELCVFDWKTASKPKKKEWITDYCLQITAYTAAVNHLYHVQIDHALIAIALEDQPAQLFLLNSEDLALYWQQFLLRLRLWQQQQT